MLIDPLVPRTFGGWFGRVFGLCRREFGRLATLAAGPVVVTAAYLVALNAVRQSPEQLRQRFAEAAATSPTGAVGPGAAFEIVFGRMLPIMLIFVVLLLVAGALYEGAGFFLVLRRAVDQPTSTGAALGFAVPRILPFIGWTLLGGLMLVLVTAVPVLPGILLHIGPLVAVGALAATALGVLVGVTVFSSLFGVVLLDRAGISRCRELIRGRFVATCGRMLVAALIYLGYSIAAGLIVSGVAAVIGAGLVTAILQAVVMIPALVFQVAVNLVTYAELRNREKRAVSTRTLAAELISSPAMAVRASS
ncbi:MAG TPA: hypothetical protein VH008_02810 [Pseudonocardia sp.]|jgi:hypothetical protein|nr:hypothetical protein [Pseudonocardia sp.]